MVKTTAGKNEKDRRVEELLISGPESGVVFTILLAGKLFAG